MKPRYNTPPQVEHQKIHSTNVPGIPSTGVKGASAASRSKPRSNTKKDRTLPAKSALKQVEAHSRMNKSNEKHKNRVDSSISYKRTIINSNSNTSCKTCNKCLISVNHDQCVVCYEMRVKQSSATKVWVVQIVLLFWTQAALKSMTGRIDHGYEDYLFIDGSQQNTVLVLRTDNGTEFVNKNLTDFYESVGITQRRRPFRELLSRMALLNEGITLLLKLLGQC
ncbi:hypothetical protein Tco_0363861 [Tanacetum coccineum]